ncbi:MAG: YeaH/YhbH family protein [Betaproteobacteria bacterium]|nr:YeaH/YhbH family protein [Betaproteobacteria bacterium]
MSAIIDRRINDRRKSAVNRERFIRRYKEHLRGAVSDIVSKRSIKEMEQGGKVNIPIKDISEPSFHYGQGGDRESVYPGNRKFQPGDHIARPQNGGGEGEGSGEGGGDGSDNFYFTLSREEFMNLFFDDLDLPRLSRTIVGEIFDQRTLPAGYTRSGSPRNLHILRSFKQAIARRIASAATLEKEIARLRETEPCDPDEVALLERRMDNIPFIDEMDLRYRNRVKVPQPVSQAVMFCLMDVSASMDETKKDLAKRFFTLLYLFLSRKYGKVEIVFIRHTDNAEEVDENTFFHDPQSGGTVVFSALKLMREIIDARFPTGQWNIYGAQASDGDAFGADPEKSRSFLEAELLPLTRYFAYIEIAAKNSFSSLWQAYGRVDVAHFAKKRVSERGDIYPVFRELFSSGAKSKEALACSVRGELVEP